MKKLAGFAVAVSLFVAPFTASAEVLTFAMEDADVFPWQFSAGGGADSYLIETAAKNLGHSVSFVRVPWKRCLATMKKNEVDGCFSASYKAKRGEFGIYPMAGDSPDASKRLHSSSYTLYVGTDSQIDWDGTDFKNLDGKIGSVAGYSIVEQLKESGAEVYEAGKLEQLFKMLEAGRLSGVASLTAQADRLISQSDKFQKSIRKVETPLTEKGYYLMFSHGRSEGDPSFVQAFYDEIAKVRESQEYQDFYSGVLKR
ncbi:substrate-binding periplasmic protein [Roseibium sp.]|uniref:substrate-binding periplasmic protein n=1 Tax=Roseibium sp. TaxID=1936156 RepID=UPI003B51A79F